MTEFDNLISPSRRLFRRRFSGARLAEAGFRWLARATIAFIAIAAVLLAVLSGGQGLTDLPTTRRQWLILVTMFLVVLAGVIAYHTLVPAAR
ncbi:hypothetical protein LBW59_25095 [Ralstonia solanacearum]|uniref:Transmembrane protein n=1 Tax=Ralstonia solanacearum TaxID=305 RepID=A0AAW5ZVN9_RALSL|nr:hypothetical protein [Ralstonia solanacearum]MDB0509864.1 hypothetical protein [Ralstonia solanacearum]MDB0574008.1 hypothetical protein [Ralstonia solanacearum]